MEIPNLFCAKKGGCLRTLPVVSFCECDSESDSEFDSLLIFNFLIFNSLTFNFLFLISLCMLLAVLSRCLADVLLKATHKHMLVLVADRRADILHLKRSCL